MMRLARTRSRHQWLVVLLLGPALLAGCGPRARAPVLEDNPVYVNDREGFRFLVPEGWHQAARAELPPGKLDQERLLVQYRQLDPDRPATFEVSAADLPASTDIGTYLAGPAYGAREWRSRTPPQKIEAGGVAGTRYDLAARVDKDDLVREVTAFRRGERVYLFTALFLAKDDTSRGQCRRAVNGLVWK
jgi:hypothetical protein